MFIHIDSDDLLRASENKEGAGARIIRSAAYFLLASIGDIPDETDGVVPTGTSVTRTVTETATAGDLSHTKTTSVTTAAPPAPPAPPAPTAPPPPPPADVSGSTEDDDSDDETEGTNTGNVPPPPPPTNAGIAALPQSSNPATYAAGVSGVASVPVEVDAAGMPWDERIHQKGKSKKKDLTWKLKKGVDTALVQSVTAELAARRAAAPAPTAGSLPAAPPATGSNSVPVPPVSNVPAPPGVPAPNGVGGAVPVPPAPAVGGVGASDSLTPYRKLIDKITDLTKAGKLTPAKVNEICTSHGSPSLMQLKNFEALIPAVDKDIDAAALGLM